MGKINKIVVQQNGVSAEYDIGGNLDDALLALDVNSIENPVEGMKVLLIIDSGESSVTFPIDEDRFIIWKDNNTEIGTLRYSAEEKCFYDSKGGTPIVWSEKLLDFKYGNSNVFSGVNNYYAGCLISPLDIEFLGYMGVITENGLILLRGVRTNTSMFIVGTSENIIGATKHSIYLYILGPWKEISSRYCEIQEANLYSLVDDSQFGVIYKHIEEPGFSPSEELIFLYVDGWHIANEVYYKKDEYAEFLIRNNYNFRNISYKASNKSFYDNDGNVFAFFNSDGVLNLNSEYNQQDLEISVYENYILCSYTFNEEDGYAGFEIAWEDNSNYFWIGYDGLEDPLKYLYVLDGYKSRHFEPGALYVHLGYDQFTLLGNLDLEYELMYMQDSIKFCLLDIQSLRNHIYDLMEDSKITFEDTNNITYDDVF